MPSASIRTDVRPGPARSPWRCIVLRFQWNALRVGDDVVLHDPDDPGMGLVPGTVAMVQTSPGSNDLGIRVTAGRGGRRMVRPARLAVHLAPADASDDCWRCARLAAS